MAFSFTGFGCLWDTYETQISIIICPTSHLCELAFTRLHEKVKKNVFQWNQTCELCSLQYLQASKTHMSNAFGPKILADFNWKKMYKTQLSYLILFTVWIKYLILFWFWLTDNRSTLFHSGLGWGGNTPSEVVQKVMSYDGNSSFNITVAVML